MTDTTSAPTGVAGRRSAVAALAAEAEAVHAETARLRQALGDAEIDRQRLMTALDVAIQALPVAERAGPSARLDALARRARPERGRHKDTRVDTAIRFLAEQTLTPFDLVKVGDLRIHLAHLGLKAAPSYASNVLARLAEQGYVSKRGHGLYRINKTHPRLTQMALRQLEAERHGLEADVALAVAEAREEWEAELAAETEWDDADDWDAADDGRRAAR